MAALGGLDLSKVSLKKVGPVADRSQPNLTMPARPEAQAAPLMSYDEARRRHAAAGLSGTLGSETVKILVLQRNSVDAAELDGILTQDRETTGRRADFVVLPEGAHHEGGRASIEENGLLRSLAGIVAKHGCWAVLGTMGELIPG